MKRKRTFGKDIGRKSSKEILRTASTERGKKNKADWFARYNIPDGGRKR